MNLSVTASVWTDGKVNLDKLNDELEKIDAKYNGKLISDDNRIESLPVTVIKDGYEVEIKGDVKDNNKPIVPDGFYHVEDTTVEDGYVISDKEGDDLDNTKGGNQFVWVPVDNYSDFVRREGYSNGELDSKLPSCGEANSTGVNSKVEETATTQVEAQEMYASVEKYGGFYIGRYETGKDSSGNVVIKKGENPYVQVKWSANGEMQETNGTTGGAVELARNFDTANNYTSVTSTLIYGVQWDATMKWMENIENPNVEGKTYIQNSTGMGWYSNNYSSGNPNHQTGIDVGENKSNCVKNIYDLAGNVYEYTMESYNTDRRVLRGCGYMDGGYFPASVRSNTKTDNSTSYTGFRIALYIKNV